MNLLAFIQSHGFAAHLNADGTISLHIPFVRHDRTTGEDVAIVSTLSEARDALGY